jgi:hypothetical protein
MPFDLLHTQAGCQLVDVATTQLPGQQLGDAFCSTHNNGCMLNSYQNKASKQARKQAMDECTLQMDFVSRPVMRDASAWLPVGPGRAATDSARHSGSSVSSSSGLSGAYGDMMQHTGTMYTSTLYWR